MALGVSSNSGGHRHCGQSQACSFHTHFTLHALRMAKILFLTFVFKCNRTYVDGSPTDTIIIPVALTSSMALASSAISLSAGMVTHFHNKRMVCGAKCLPFLGCKVSRQVANVDPINYMGVVAVSSASASTVSASTTVSGMSASPSTMSGPSVHCIDSLFLSPLLLIIKLGRAVDSGNLLGEVPT